MDPMPAPPVPVGLVDPSRPLLCAVLEAVYATRLPADVRRELAGYAVELSVLGARPLALASWIVPPSLAKGVLPGSVGPPSTPLGAGAPAAEAERPACYVARWPSSCRPGWRAAG